VALNSIDSWYSYYAGFTSNFVLDVLSVLAVSPESTILDPWNGAGTTTSVASKLGYKAIGNDLNPAMSIIARSRSAVVTQQNRLEVLAQNAMCASSKDIGLLTELFPHKPAKILRSIREGIVPGKKVNHQNLTSDQEILMTCLFATARLIAAPLKGSNPTWWKSDAKKSVSATLSNDIDRIFFNNVSKVSLLLEAASNSVSKSLTIQTGDATSLQIGDESVDAIITSPPYLTRIDYALAMLPELALMGFTREDLLSMRISMLGSVMGGKTVPYANGWGVEAKSCLDHALAAAIARKRNDGSYYEPFFARYFDQLYRSIGEMDRVLTPSGKVAIVVQPSRHRGKLIDLPKIVEEMGISFGWEAICSIAWPTRDLGRINPKSSKYTQHKIHETAVLMRKP
jgi:DNA modification methylase